MNNPQPPQTIKAHDEYILSKAYEDCQTLGYSKKEKKVFINNIKEQLKRTRTKRILQKRLFLKQHEGW